MDTASFFLPTLLSLSQVGAIALWPLGLSVVLGNVSALKGLMERWASLTRLLKTEECRDALHTGDLIHSSVSVQASGPLALA